MAWYNPLSWGRTVLQEATNPYPAGAIDSDEHLFRSLGSSTRSASPYIQSRALKLAWELFERNPLAHGVVEVMKDHVVGDGFRVESENEDVQTVLTKHWEDPINLWDLKQHDRVRELSLFGEQLYLAFVNEADGHVRLASVDPLHVREVWVNSENPDDVLAVVVNSKLGVESGGQGGVGWQGDKVYRAIHVDEDPESATEGLLVGALPGETYIRPHGKTEREYDGSCFWFTINKVTGTRRGRSDLLSTMDWLDMIDQILFNFSDRALLMNNFIWDVELTGATQGQVDEWKRAHSGAPPPAAVRVHNEKQKWQAVAPSFHSEEYESLHKSVKSMTLSGPGLPPHWFGEQDTNRATALEMGSPTLKRLAARQLFVKHMISHICQFQIDQAIIHNTLPKPSEEEPYLFTVVVPEMSVRDASQGAEALQSVTNSLVMAESAGMIDMTAATRLFALAAVQIGADLDVDEMVERMEQAGLAPGQKAVDEAAEILRRQSQSVNGANADAMDSE